MTRLRGVLGLFAVAALSATPSCADAAAPGSPTRITVGATGELSGGLLTEGDLRAVVGLPSDMAVVEVSDLRAYEDRDPRGPCGAKVSPLATARAAGVGLKSSAISGVELVVQGRVNTLRAYFAQRRADTRLGCAEFQTETGQGTQRVKLDRVITLRVSVDESLAIQRATLLSGRVSSSTTIELRRGDTAARLVLFGPSPLEENVVQAVASRMARRLASLSDS